MYLITNYIQQIVFNRQKHVCNVAFFSYHVWDNTKKYSALYIYKLQKHYYFEKKNTNNIYILNLSSNGQYVFLYWSKGGAGSPKCSIICKKVNTRFTFRVNFKVIDQIIYIDIEQCWRNNWSLGYPILQNKIIGFTTINFDITFSISYKCFNNVYRLSQSQKNTKNFMTLFKCDIDFRSLRTCLCNIRDRPGPFLPLVGRKRMHFSIVGSHIPGQVRWGEVRWGQLRSECLTCTFKARCCSARLSRAQVPAFVGSSVRDRKKLGGTKRGTACTGGYNGVQAVVADGWCFMEFGMSHRIKQKEKYVRISMNEVWHNFDGLSKNNDFVDVLSKPKVAEIGPSRLT